MVGGRAEPGGDQEGAELVAVQGGGVRLIVQPRPSHVRGGRVVEELFLDGVPVEPGDVRSRATVARARALGGWAAAGPSYER